MSECSAATTCLLLAFELGQRSWIARKWLWAGGCLLAVATLYVTVISNMHGGATSGVLNVPDRDWAVLWEKVLKWSLLDRDRRGLLAPADHPTCI